MRSDPPKYSIIIPTYNGIQYLPTCLETILSQNYLNYELIISNDHSTDATHEFLEKLSHDNVKIIDPPEELSMSEHWEWALSHASGEWCIFVGQDDGLQPYFFDLADRLTEQARKHGLRSIMSTRAYFFWKGCEYVFGDIAVSFTAINKIKIHNFKFEALKALMGVQDYFELPQMYTTALFHKDLLNEARLMQNGNVFTCHPQDANLAAIACSLEKNYLKSYIPLGWVGSSPKSAGMSISGNSSAANNDDKQMITQLKQDYLKKILKSKIKYNHLAGNFSLGNGSIYFWQALLSTNHLRLQKVNDILSSNFFKILMFSSVFFRIKHSKAADFRRDELLGYFDDILVINNINIPLFYLCYFCTIIVVYFAYPIKVFFKVLRKLSRELFSYFFKYYFFWRKDDAITMINASLYIKSKLLKMGWV